MAALYNHIPMISRQCPHEMTRLNYASCETPRAVGKALTFNLLQGV
ncbi:hypothetical protein JAB5_35320 [Janthinobacterium sp. HH103]|nr:hypothetical protein JAB2_23220 [Janthinobacterium sp. HH100]OEZ73424.1 hypothetical protein JAB5_35320 [Janthinobacterium sp. HH103]OEZ90506.1 hypothetical protein JAB8_19490 [Janthinobacterium sp. HH106]QOU76345.1 hypothetical protein JAB4_058450 [Janthinobacterium sp. HH102]